MIELFISLVIIVQIVMGAVTFNVVMTLTAQVRINAAIMESIDLLIKLNKR